MPGKFEGEPEWAEYFWTQVVLDGFGEDRHEDGVWKTYVPISLEDVKKFPKLGELNAKYVVLWEDEQGFVFCRPAERIPDDPDLDCEPNESGFTIHPVKR